MFEKQLKELREQNVKRNFTQTADLFINFNPDGKRKLNVSGNIILPHGKGKVGKVAVFADTTTTKAKELGIDVIDKQTLMQADKAFAEEISSKYSYFLAENSLMLEIGKRLGPVLAPKGRMPRPYSPESDLKAMILSGENTFSVKITKQTLHLTVGSEEFTDEQLEENLESIISFLDKNMPKGRQQIKSIYLKFTMSPTVRLL